MNGARGVPAMSEQIESRLDRLEALVGDQQETIRRQREQIASLTTQQGPARVVADGGDIKITTGDFDVDGGTGVLGSVTGTGETCGVRGEVTSGEGYGLMTPDSARVDGVTELATLAGDLTGQTTITDLLGPGLSSEGGALAIPSLPDYDAVGDDPAGDIAALGRLFRRSAWGDMSFRTGPTHEDIGSAFSGAALAPTGEVVFAPYRSDNVGIYDPETNSYRSGPPHEEGSNAFAGAALAPTGDIVFAPDESASVGIFDPLTEEYTSGPDHGAGGDFNGAVVAPTGEVILIPRKADNVGIYDPVTEEYTAGPLHNEGSLVFNGGALAPTGEIIFAPINPDNVGIYDPETESYTSGATVSDSFNGGILTTSGGVVFAPRDNDNVGLLSTGATTTTEVALHPFVNEA